MEYRRLTVAEKDRHPSIHYTGSVRGMKRLGLGESTTIASGAGSTSTTSRFGLEDAKRSYVLRLLKARFAVRSCIGEESQGRVTVRQECPNFSKGCEAMDIRRKVTCPWCKKEMQPPQIPPYACPEPQYTCECGARAPLGRTGWMAGVEEIQEAAYRAATDTDVGRKSGRDTDVPTSKAARKEKTKNDH